MTVVGQTDQGARYPSLSGKSVFVTGGATGIGAAIVDAFAQQGAFVAFADIDEHAGSALEGRFGEDRTRFTQCDVSDTKALQRVIDGLGRGAGGFDVLVNNAARDDRHTLDDLTPGGWDDLMAVNLKPQFFAAQAAAKSMKRLGGGTIINLASNAALLGLAGYPAYVAAKGAIISMTKALARELGPADIRVNAVAPGWVITERQEKLWLTPDAESELMAQQSLKARIEPDDVARLCLFLASSDSRFITGQCLVIDGGRV